MASFAATIKKTQLDGNKVDEVVHVEGETTKVLYRGSIAPIIQRYLGGLASGMTYIGAENIEDIKGKADFITITSAGMKESTAHGKE